MPLDIAQWLLLIYYYCENRTESTQSKARRVDNKNTHKLN